MCVGGGGSKGYVGPPFLKLFVCVCGGGGGAVPMPMQVSQFFLSSEIIYYLFCYRVSCSHGLRLEHPTNEHQSLATLSYIMDLFNSNQLDCFEH